MATHSSISCLGNPMDRGAWRATVHGVTESWAQLKWLSTHKGQEVASPIVQQVKTLPAMQETQEMSVWSLGWKYPLEKEMATHSSSLAWRIPCIEDPFKQVQTVGHDWVTTYTHIGQANKTEFGVFDKIIPSRCCIST